MRQLLSWNISPIIINNDSSIILIALDFQILQSVYILAVMNLCLCCKKTDMSVTAMEYLAHQLKNNMDYARFCL